MQQRPRVAVVLEECLPRAIQTVITREIWLLTTNRLSTERVGSFFTRNDVIGISFGAGESGFAFYARH